MKKRLVAVMLGLTLSLATVGEAGAAAFSSPDSETVQAEITETEKRENNMDFTLITLFFLCLYS